MRQALRTRDRCEPSTHLVEDGGTLAGSTGFLVLAAAATSLPHALQSTRYMRSARYSRARTSLARDRFRRLPRGPPLRPQATRIPTHCPTATGILTLSRVFPFGVLMYPTGSE